MTKEHPQQLSMAQIDAFASDHDMARISNLVIAPLMAANIATIRANPSDKEAYAASVRQLATVLKSFSNEVLQHMTQMIVRQHEMASIRPATLLNYAALAEKQLKTSATDEAGQIKTLRLYAMAWKQGNRSMGAFSWQGHPAYPTKLVEAGLLDVKDLVWTDHWGRKQTGMLNADQFDQLLEQGVVEERHRMPHHVRGEVARERAYAINRMLYVAATKPSYWKRNGVTTPRQAREFISREYNRILSEHGQKTSQDQGPENPQTEIYTDHGTDFA